MYITPLSCLLSDFIPLPLPKNTTLDWLKTVFFFLMLSTATHRRRPKTYILSYMSHSQMTDYPVPPISVPDTMLNCSQKSCEIDVRNRKKKGGGGLKSSMKSTKVAAYTIKNIKNTTFPFNLANTVVRHHTISASLAVQFHSTHQRCKQYVIACV